jgi:hypothetical protein
VLPNAPGIEPRQLIWPLQAQAAAQTVRNLLPKGNPHRIIGVQPGDPTYAAVLVADPDDRGYLLTIMPAGTARPAHASIVLQTDCARTFVVEAAVGGLAATPARR